MLDGPDYWTVPLSTPNGNLRYITTLRVRGAHSLLRFAHTGRRCPRTLATQVRVRTLLPCAYPHHSDSCPERHTVCDRLQSTVIRDCGVLRCAAVLRAHTWTPSGHLCPSTQTEYFQFTAPVLTEPKTSIRCEGHDIPGCYATSGVRHREWLL